MTPWNEEDERFLHEEDLERERSERHDYFTAAYDRSVGVRESRLVRVIRLVVATGVIGSIVLGLLYALLSAHIHIGF